MHTDEYGITLSREVHIAKKKVEEHQRNVRRFEERYGMQYGVFLKKLEDGELPDGNPDFPVWKDQCSALHRWEQRLKEFEELYTAWR